MKKSFLIGLLVVVSSISFAQKNINSYKYIIVPNQFDFQKSKDIYQLNSLTKFLFEREGFIGLFENEQFPMDLASDRCLGLRVDLIDNSSMFTTKLKMNLIDCNNAVVFSSKEVKSKSKDFKTAYQEAIRKAFVDVEDLNYVYSEKTEIVDIEESDEIITEEQIEIKKEVESAEVVEKNETKQVDKVIEIKEIKGEERLIVVKPEDEIERRTFKSVSYNIEGTYSFDNWGKSVISKNEDEFSVIGGDENFEFATIYKTSKPTIFIIKWAAFKQPQLLEIGSDGNLKVDTTNGIKTYNRIN